MSDNKQDQFNQQQQEFRNTGEATSDGLSTNQGRECPIDKRSGGLNEITEEARKRAVSSKKVDANRRNAKRSTGPKTAMGKQTVSRNAVRHGFFSKFLLIQHRDGKESQREFDDFLTDVREHYEPVGFLEELWTEKIAVWSWRLRRLIRCESGQIAKALVGHRHDIHRSREGDLTDPQSESSSSPEMDAMTDHLFLPEKDELDKLLRYEAMINRQLNHAIAELERIQARRKGASSVV
jgi:hypothetical protein